MQKLSGQLFSLVLLTELVLGWGGWAVLRKIFPDQIFTWYPYIPSVFLILGCVVTYVLTKNYKLEGKKLVNLYMILKLIKMFVVMIYVLGFYFIVKNDLRVFGSVFAVFYAVYIGLETYIFYSVEKQIKKEA